MKCFYCENIFEPKKWNSKFCSTKCCAQSAYQKRIGLNGKKSDQRACLHCSSLFHYSAKKYCSSECLSKATSKKRNNVRRSRLYSALRVKYDVAEILERDGTRCGHCGVETQCNDSCIDSFRNIDHIIPLSKGGHDCKYNVQVLCKICNNLKGSKLLDIDVSKAKRLWPEDPVGYFNSRKSTTKKNNKSGVTGVFYCKGSGKWVSRIEVGSKRIESKSKEMDLAIEKRELMIKLAKDGNSVNQIKLMVKEYASNKKTSSS